MPSNLIVGNIRLSISIICNMKLDAELLETGWTMTNGKLTSNDQDMISVYT